MKRKITVIILSMLLVLQLTGCVSKTAITAEEFSGKLEGMGYTVTDISEQYPVYTKIADAIVAQNEDGFQVEFYVLANENDAQSMYNTNRQTFENSKGNVSGELSTSLGNYASYSLTSGGYYMYISRVDNTLFYAKVESTHQEEVKEIIESLGY